MTSVPPPPPGPVDPENSGPSQQPGQFAHPGPAQPWAAPQQGQPGQQWGQQGQQWGQPGQYPQQGQPGQHAPQGQPGQYPQQGQPGQYAPQGQPGQYAPQPQPGQYPPQGQWGAQPPAGGSRNKTAIIIVSVIGAVLLLGFAVGAFFLLSSSDVELLPEDVDAQTTAHARELTVGNCLLSLPTDDAVTDVTVVPCGDAHDAQVVAAKKFSGQRYPGTAKIIDKTTKICPGKSITSDSAPETLEFLVWTPSEDSWSEGDRAGLCIASSPDEELTESLIR